MITSADRIRVFHQNIIIHLAKNDHKCTSFYLGALISKLLLNRQSAFLLFTSILSYYILFIQL